MEGHFIEYVVNLHVVIFGTSSFNVAFLAQVLIRNITRFEPDKNLTQSHDFFYTI